MKGIHYVLNQYNHFFVIEGEVDITQFIDCTLYSDLSCLLEAAAKANNCTADEVQGTELGFTFIDNQWLCNESMDIDSLESMSIETYLSYFKG